MEITVFYTVPFALIQLTLRGVIEQRDLSRLRLVIFGGEPMPPKHLASLMAQLPHVSFDNIYGPAEVNGCSHYTLPCPPEPDAVIPIGPICQIAEALILNAQAEPVTDGEIGELLVRTPSMMAGYWNRSDLNDAAFFQREEDGLPQTYYRTGDLVRELGDGILEFLGRSDRQTKVRGYRVELDEIESTLTAHAAIEEAAIYTVTGELGQSEIRGAFMPTVKDIEHSPDDFLVYLKERLPWYAVPITLRPLQQFPRTSTGKIDRRALQIKETQ